MRLLRSARVAIGVGAALLLGVVVVLTIARPQQQPASQRPVATAAPALVSKSRRIPPPLFSRAYVEALNGVLDLEPEDVSELEARLAKKPDDFAARLKLTAYCMRADRAGLDESRIRRAELMLWLVEHQPDSEILGSPYASAQDLTPAQWRRAIGLWKSALKMRHSDARVWWNAAQFYRPHDRGSHLACLEKAVALDPDNENYGRQLGLFYAGAILTANPASLYRDPAGADPDLARRAIERLETTNSAPLLAAAVKLLQSEYNSSLMRGSENASVGELARRYFERAKALDPEIDEAWVFPKLDQRMAGMLAPGARPPEDLQVRFAAAAKEIRRLSPDAFPALPPAVASILRGRRCLVPQPMLDGPPRNVVRGEFFEQGQTGWAVLCSAGGFSSILVFRDNADANPEELARHEDKGYLQDIGEGRIAYSREIRAVDRDFIMRHYRAYGGPKPPPIDHHGIDDAFLEKASITYYRHRGKWRRLQGAD